MSKWVVRWSRSHEEGRRSIVGCLLVIAGAWVGRKIKVDDYVRSVGSELYGERGKNQLFKARSIWGFLTEGYFGNKIQFCVENLIILAMAGTTRRSKVKDISVEVVDINPYSRLMALQRMGIVDNYERIWDFSVAIAVCTDSIFSIHHSLD
ncbi:unnamed protein product [Lactuca saligna]|uniref:Uncharacterized protein n=1 Tax=Lactuca saligna TaxID=75948 RepID=A0AA35UTX8_LACSI|nr:unnamed protein product [Lactuca saligna]